MVCFTEIDNQRSWPPSGLGFPNRLAQAGFLGKGQRSQEQRQHVVSLKASAKNRRPVPSTAVKNGRWIHGLLMAGVARSRGKRVGTGREVIMAVL